MGLDQDQAAARRGRRGGNFSGWVTFAVVLAFVVLGAAIVAYTQHKIQLELLIAVLSLFATVAFALWHTRVYQRRQD